MSNPAEFLRSRSRSLVKIWLLAAALGAASLAPLSPLQAQDAWRGLNVPEYPDATDYVTSSDDDEYEIYFRSEDDAQDVFDFYRDYLTREGFEAGETQIEERGFKTELRRGQGGPDDTIELDVKTRNGRHDVEIEFDE